MYAEVSVDYFKCSDSKLWSNISNLFTELLEVLTKIFYVIICRHKLSRKWTVLDFHNRWRLQFLTSENDISHLILELFINIEGRQMISVEWLQ